MQKIKSWDVFNLWPLLTRDVKCIFIYLSNTVPVIYLGGRFFLKIRPWSKVHNDSMIEPIYVNVYMPFLIINTKAVLRGIGPENYIAVTRDLFSMISFLFKLFHHFLSFEKNSISALRGANFCIHFIFISRNLTLAGSWLQSLPKVTDGQLLFYQFLLNMDFR